MFFQKSKYDSCMHFVDVGESCSSGYEDCPLSKLCRCWVGCLKVGIFLLDVYVGARDSSTPWFKQETTSTWEFRSLLRTELCGLCRHTGLW